MKSYLYSDVFCKFFEFKIVLNSFFFGKTMPKSRKCSVLSCQNTSENCKLPFHGFPNPTKKLQLFNAWIEAVGNKDLLKLKPEFISKSRFVCRKHFAPQHLYPKHLTVDAIPTLYLPDEKVSVTAPEDTSTMDPLETTNIDCPDSNLHNCTYTQVDLNNCLPELLHTSIESSIESLNSEISVSKSSLSGTSSISQLRKGLITSSNVLLTTTTSSSTVFNSSHTNCNEVETYSKSASATTPLPQKMSLLASQNMAEICRVCLHLDGEVNLLKNRYDNINYFDILEEVVGSKLHDEDPKSICNGCEDSLIKAYMFKKQSQNSERTLEMLNKQKKERTKQLSLLDHDYDHTTEDLMTTSIQSKPSIPVVKKRKLITKFYMYRGNIKENVDYTKLVEIDKTTAITLTKDKTKYKKMYLTPTKNNTRKSTLNNNKNILRRAFQLAMMGRTVEAKKLTQKSTIPNRLDKIITQKLKAKKYTYPMNCKSCGEHLERHADYKTHVTLTQHFHTPFPCDHCSRVFPSENRLKCHKKSLEPHNCRLCDKCGRSFSTNNNLQTHIKMMHSGREKFRCSICGNAHLSLKHLVRHRRLIHPGVHAPKTLVCELCGIKLASNSSLALHRKRVHLNIRPLTCVICDAKFYTRALLKKHESVHSLDTFECGFCNVVLKHQEKLIKHREQHHPGLSIDANVNTEYSRCYCTFCKTVCPNKQALSVHLRDHKIVCIYCDDCTSFRSEEDLEDHHANLHKDIWEWMCRYCNKLYQDGNSLYAHLFVHKNKVFKCDECPKMYDSSNKLKRHKLFHEGVMNYECRFCSKRFRYLTSRAIHERIHTGERPYKCEICGSSHMCSSSRSKHRKTHYIDPNDSLNLEILALEAH